MSFCFSPVSYCFHTLASLRFTLLDKNSRNFKVDIVVLVRVSVQWSTRCIGVQCVSTQKSARCVSAQVSAQCCTICFSTVEYIM